MPREGPGHEPVPQMFGAGPGTPPRCPHAAVGITSISSAHVRRYWNPPSRLMFRENPLGGAEGVLAAQQVFGTVLTARHMSRRGPEAPREGHRGKGTEGREPREGHRHENPGPADVKPTAHTTTATRAPECTGRRGHSRSGTNRSRFAPGGGTGKAFAPGADALVLFAHGCLAGVIQISHAVDLDQVRGTGHTRR